MNIWKLSIQDTPCYVRIRANSEARARQIATELFADKIEDKLTHPTIDWSKVAWNDKSKVVCELEDDDISTHEGVLDIV